MKAFCNNTDTGLILDGHFTSKSLTPYIRVFRDSTRQLSIDDAAATDPSLFTILPVNKGNLGYSDDIIWARFTLNNTGESAFTWYLESGYPSLDHVDLYSRGKDGWKIYKAGDHIPYSQWEIKYRNPVLPIVSQPGVTTYYLRIESEGSQVLRLNAYTPETFTQKKENEMPWLWLYYGMMFAMAIYNLFIYVSVRETSYLNLVFFIVCIAVFSLIFNGMAPGIFWPNSVWLTNHANPFWVMLSCAATLMFTMSFLSFRKNYPRIGSAIYLLILSCFISAFLSLVLPYSIMTRLSVYLIILTCVVGLMAGFMTLKYDIKSSIFFIFSWSLYLVGAISVSLYLKAYTPDSFFANWSYQIGSTLIAMLLSLGIADRINYMRKQMIYQYNQIQEQYIDLDRANEELRRVHRELLDASSQISIEKEQLGATLRSIGDAVISYNVSGCITLMNPVAEKLTGWSFDEAQGKHIRDILKLKDRDSEETFFTIINQSAASNRGETIGIPFTLVDRQGEEHIIEVNSTPIVAQDQVDFDTVMAIRDITDKYRMEKEIVKMSKIESLGVLAGGIAHDFNNLLTAILGNLSMIRTFPEIDSAVKEIIDKIDTASQRAMNLTRQILTFSRGGAPIRKTTSISSLVHECAGLALIGSNVKSELHVPDDLWNAEADADQISQVFNNIILNGTQAMPDGGILTIRAGNITSLPANIPLPEGEYIYISISDTGSGIKHKDISRIFDPFFTTKVNGTGLGLASSYSIIKKHRGWIDVSSSDKGTTFCIYLQASRRQQADSSSKVSQPLKSTSGNILIMDDEKSILDVAGRMLRYLGYRVTPVTDGEKALEVYTNTFNEGIPFDAVIMDLTIPGGMGGKETLNLLKKVNPSVIAIVSSGYSEDPIMSRYKLYGFKGVLLKPYRIDNLSQILHDVLAESPETGI